MVGKVGDWVFFCGRRLVVEYAWTPEWSLCSQPAWPGLSFSRSELCFVVPFTSLSEREKERAEKGVPPHSCATHCSSCHEKNCSIARANIVAGRSCARVERAVLLMCSTEIQTPIYFMHVQTCWNSTSATCGSIVDPAQSVSPCDLLHRHLQPQPDCCLQGNTKSRVLPCIPNVAKALVPCPGSD